MLEECALERNPWREDGRYADDVPWHTPKKVYSADSSNWVPQGASRPAARPDDSVADQLELRAQTTVAMPAMVPTSAKASTVWPMGPLMRSLSSGYRPERNVSGRL